MIPLNFLIEYWILEVELNFKLTAINTFMHSVDMLNMTQLVWSSCFRLLKIHYGPCELVFVCMSWLSVRIFQNINHSLHYLYKCWSDHIQTPLSSSSYFLTRTVSFLRTHVDRHSPSHLIDCTFKDSNSCSCLCLSVCHDTCHLPRQDTSTGTHWRHINELLKVIIFIYSQNACYNPSSLLLDNRLHFFVFFPYTYP